MTADQFTRYAKAAGYPPGTTVVKTYTHNAQHRLFWKNGDVHYHVTDGWQTTHRKVATGFDAVLDYEAATDQKTLAKMDMDILLEDEPINPLLVTDA